MKIQLVIQTINQMQADGVITSYAIGGAVGATFYLEPVATFDMDVFVGFKAEPDSLLGSPQPICDYLRSLGYPMKGEYVVIGDWPVQILAPAGPLGEEALSEAGEKDVEGTPTRVFTAEHLAAIALQTGRSKDKTRLLQFLETKSLNMLRFHDILQRHELADRWRQFQLQFQEATS